MSLRILTTPVRLGRELRVSHLIALVSADALRRWHEAQGDDVEWLPSVLAGDLSSQHEVERDLAREGSSRAELERAEFVDRVRAFEVEHRARAQALLAQLCVEADLEHAALDNEDAARAARIAFVRLYEAGFLVNAERVVHTCPRCETVVDVVVDAAEGDAARVTLRLAVADGDGSVDVRLTALELLPGAVAVGVPEGHERAGASVGVPLTGRVVPVIADGTLTEAVLLVPAHDATAFDVCLRAGVTPAEVLDADGIVRAPGPLEGLPRFAAREIARELVTTEGLVVDVEPGPEDVARCFRCGTPVVPRLGSHWFLPMAPLAMAAGDALRQGEVTVSPPVWRDELLARTAAAGDWCVSHQVWSGQPVPTARCLDCGQTAVAVDMPDSCGKCMGTLVPTDDVLDARFVGVVWALASAGWPDAERDVADTAARTTVVIGPLSLGWWIVPMAAVGLRLAGVIPFGAVSVFEPTPPVEADTATLADVVAHADEAGGVTVRLSLLGGDLDLERGALVRKLLDQPATGEGDPTALAATVADSFAAGTPGAALAAVAAAAQAGVADPAVVGPLAAPLRGG